MRTNTHTTPAEALHALKSKVKTWQDVAGLLPEKFDRSYLRRVAMGKPASPKLCHALGVAEPAKLVGPCANCGKVHDTVKPCNYTRKPRAKSTLTPNARRVYALGGP